MTTLLCAALLLYSISAGGLEAEPAGTLGNYNESPLYFAQYSGISSSVLACSS